MAIRTILFSCAFIVSVLGAPRLNELQVIGTHNSYHIAPHPSLMAMIRGALGAEADTLEYTHRSLGEQFSRFGIRQIELDLYADASGGRFSQPIGITKALERKMIAPPTPGDLLKLPGIKIFHSPDFNYQTTVETLREGLVAVREWSRANPAHVPIMVMLELKGPEGETEFTPTEKWNETSIASIDREILQVFSRQEILAPDDVRKEYATLREAILDDGWPALGDVRGKVMFALDNTDYTRELYLGATTNLVGQLLFVSVAESHPAAAWFKINDPVKDFDKIQRLVRQGFMVRTRADAGTTQARQNATSQRERAFASGAQFISTDYPEPNLSWSSYSVRWTNGIVARPNPISAAGLLQWLDLETLAQPELAPFGHGELTALNARAMHFHGQRRLNEASADYDRLLTLDPPGSLSQARRETILALAPTLRLVEGEPFPLEAVVATHHPTRHLIAYHLFWDDDLDFPDDNDPTDHEVVWVEYDPATNKSKRLYTYFHGQILSTESTSSPPAFAVEWGKHGSLPFSMPDSPQPVQVEALSENWQRLVNRTRRPDSPLARKWPKRFDGDFSAYTRFVKDLPLRSLLIESDAMFVTEWANATINRRALPYNFAAKTEWPTPKAR